MRVGQLLQVLQTHFFFRSLLKRVIVTSGVHSFDRREVSIVQVWVLGRDGRHYLILAEGLFGRFVVGQKGRR